MPTDLQDSEKTPTGMDGLLDVHASRRRMLRRSLSVAAPVVVTLASGSVSAGTCVRASGFTSVATFNSRNPAGLNNCAGRSPAAWIALDSGSWPSGINKGQTTGGGGADLGNGTKFNEIFPAPDLTSDWSILNVLSGSVPGEFTAVAANIAAMYLNTLANLTNGVFDQAYVLGLWNNIAGTTPYGFKPQLGTPWTLMDTADWMAKTWT